jgi:hypothetical protein
MVTAAHQPSAAEPRVVPLDRRAALLGAAALFASTALTGGAAHAKIPECSSFTTAPSGLQWCDLAEGSGEAPVAGARIRAHYTGQLQSGAVFDSSYERGRPLIFQASGPHAASGHASIRTPCLREHCSPDPACRLVWAKLSRDGTR